MVLIIMTNISACTISITFICIVMHLLTVDMKPSLAMMLHNHDPEPAIVDSGGVYHRRRYPPNSNGRGSYPSHRSRANNAYKGLFAPLNKQGEIDQKRQYYEKKMAEWREKKLGIILDRLGEDYVLVRNPDDESLESEELKKASDKFVSLWEGFYDISGEEDLIDSSQESAEQYNYENYVDDSSSATATPKDNEKYTTEKITTERTTTEVSATEKSTTKTSITEKFTSTRQNHSPVEPAAGPTMEPNKLPETTRTPVLPTSAIQDPTQKRAYYEKKMAEWKEKQKGCVLNRSSGKDFQHPTKWNEIMQNDGSKEAGESLNAAFRPVNFINE